MPAALSDLVTQQHSEPRPVRSIDLAVKIDSENASYSLHFDQHKVFISERGDMGKELGCVAITHADFALIMQEARHFEKLVKFANEGQSQDGKEG